ncbi:uncharacterized protein [Pyxicephalus adspersus]|uniref:uncharacterized protein n=1 Tax=Pyxicephalus adspersus TaxID=30357 RepID=UPI003B5B8C6C
MTHQRALSPLTLLFISLLCYGFVLVWTQNVAHETTTIFEDLSTPISPAQVKILTGGNFSVSVSPWESTTGSPDLSTQSSLALQDTVNENYTTVTPKDSLTIPPPTAMESYSTMAPMGGADDELASALGSTGALFTTANINAINTVPEVQISSTDTPSEGSTEMILGNDTTDTKATGNGVSASSDLPVLLRTMRRTSSVHQDGGETFYLCNISCASPEVFILGMGRWCQSHRVKLPPQVMHSNTGPTYAMCRRAMKATLWWDGKNKAPEDEKPKVFI